MNAARMTVMRGAFCAELILLNQLTPDELRKGDGSIGGHEEDTVIPAQAGIPSSIAT
ncbi:hypothetical protein ACQQ2N_21035 [Dokdonella sp. MW10]|uniref:hypothetical protein n=1 Tax=Dokdonella sp. MW10 TaxID=2992926 RepID=UPI003F7DB748